MPRQLLNTVTGTVLKCDEKYIRVVWRRGFLDRDHKVLTFVKAIEDATIFDSEVNKIPTDFKDFRNIYAQYFFEKSEHLNITVRTYREVTLKTEVEIHK